MNKIIIKIAIFCATFFVSFMLIETLNSPSQNAVRAICTGLAIDYAETEVEVSSQIVIPEAGGQYTQKLSIVNSKGKSIEEALEKMEFHVGKKIRLGHCGFIVISKDFCENDITKQFDYFLRGNNLGNNTLLLFTTGKGKDVLESASNVNSNEVDNLQINSKFNERRLFSKSANLLSFFNDYLSPHSTSHMPNIVVNKKSKQNEENGKSEENDSNQNSSSPSKDAIENDGKVAVFYKGKYVKLLSESEREDFNWLDSKLIDNRIRLENINTKELQNANVTFTISRKNVKINYLFTQNCPTIKVELSLGLKPESVESDTLPPAYNYLVDSVVNSAINNKISSALSNMLKLEKEYGFDVFNFYKEFNIHCHAEWQKYLKTLDGSHYLKDVRIVAHANCFDDF